MNADSHLIILAEDDPAMAADLVSYVAALGMRSRVVTTLVELEQAIADGGFCLVVLDKQLPTTKDAAPLATTGDTGLKKLRAYDPRRNAQDHHVLGIIVLTGLAPTDARISENHRMGASSYVAKPSDPERIAAEILGALDRAGRSDHAACCAIEAARTADPRVPSKPPPPETISLVLDGVRIRRRTSFVLAGKRCALGDAYFLVLLRLAAVRARGSDHAVSKADLGIIRTPEVPSRIREEAGGALPKDFWLIQSLDSGMYRLHPLVHVEPIDWDRFERHAHPGISAFAAGQKRLR